MFSWEHALQMVASPNLNVGRSLKTMKLWISMNYQPPKEIHGWICLNTITGGIPTPLKHISSSAGMEIPNWMEIHKIGSSHHQPATFWWDGLNIN